MLLLIILPFFTSLIVRTVAWQTILSDDGWIVNAFQTLGLLDANGRLLATRTAVIAGITYNFLPFMALPLYASLERLDRRLIEAATDLYASRWTAFRKVTLPLAAPGIFAGTLLTFIPAIGDYINAQLLGTSQNYMIGNVIQSQYLVVRDYPTAAALSFVADGRRPDRDRHRRPRARPAAAVGGGGRMRTTVDRIRDWAIGAWAILAIVYLFIPIFVIVLFSFNDNKGRFNFTWQGFTLKHWKDPFGVEGLQSALHDVAVDRGAHDADRA